MAVFALTGQVVTVNSVDYSDHLKNATLAVDALTGKQLWKTPLELPEDVYNAVCCGNHNRGLAVHDGLLFRTVIDATIIALDILPMEPIEGVTFLLGDIREQEVLDRLSQAMDGRLADIVVSDMAPNLSGIDSADAARVEHLIELALEFAQHHLKPEGALVAKVFHGSGYNELVKLFKDNFRVVKPVKPKASRDKSSETFLVGVGLKQPPA